MKIRTSQLYRIVIYFLLAWDTILFSMFNFNPGGKRYSVMVILGILMTCILFFSKKNTKYESIFKWPKIYALLLVAMLLVHYVYDVIINKIDGSAFMHNACYYAIFFLAFPMILIIEKDEKNFWKYINILMFLWYTWFLVQYISYQSTGVILAPGLKDLGEGLIGNNIRNGSIRLEMRAVAHITILYNFDKLYNQSKQNRKLRKYNLIMFLYGMFVLIVIEQTRGYYIAIFGAIAGLILCDNRRYKKLLLTFTIGLLAFIILYKMNIISNFLNSVFDSSGSYDKGATGLIRLQGMNMFWKGFKSNPLIGLGFQSNGDYADTGMGIFYFNDDGFVGVVGQIGIWAFILYGLMLVRFIYIVIKLFRLKQYMRATQLLGFWIYLALTSISLICYWNTTCMLCPVLWAIFEVEFYKGVQEFKYNRMLKEKAIEIQ